MDKREHLIRVAFDLFYREGVHAVGINRVLAESGVAKKTLYHHFASKDDLVAATVAYRDQYFNEWVRMRMNRLPAGRMALHELFRALDDWFNRRDPVMPAFHGCYFINLSAEFGDAEHPIHRQCAAHKRALHALVSQHLAEFITSAEEVSRLADAISLLKEGAIVQAHVVGDRFAALKAWVVVESLLGQVRGEYVTP